MWYWKEITTPLGPVSEEQAKVVREQIKYWENRMQDDLRSTLYPHAGARDEAVERLDRLSGKYDA